MACGVAHVLAGHAVHHLAARQRLPTQIGTVPRLRPLGGERALAGGHMIRRAASRREGSVYDRVVVGAVAVSRQDAHNAVHPAIAPEPCLTDRAVKNDAVIALVTRLQDNTGKFFLHSLQGFRGHIVHFDDRAVGRFNIAFARLELYPQSGQIKRVPVIAAHGKGANAHPLALIIHCLPP